MQALLKNWINSESNSEKRQFLLKMHQKCQQYCEPYYRSNLKLGSLAGLSFLFATSQPVKYIQSVIFFNLG